MCGIVGYVGGRTAATILVDALASLEYRGYDSAGISLQAPPSIESVRSVGNIGALRQRLRDRELAHAPTTRRAGATSAAATIEPTSGIGHTRWATHGDVSERNAHPHTDCEGRVHIALNGIVENHVRLRAELEAGGCELTSETDAEVVAHLIGRAYGGNLTEAVLAATRELEGHFSFVALSADEPDVLVGTRRGCPLVVGLGEDENFLASAVSAFLEQTRSFCVLDDDELVEVRAEGVELYGADGTPRSCAAVDVDWTVDVAEKRGYETFMLKEIEEQGDAVAATLSGRVFDGEVDLGNLGPIDDSVLRSIDRIVIVGCGTSYNAGLVARYAIEEWARVPVEFDVASEYRYRNPLVGKHDLVVGVSQSGETADTLVAMQLARARGATVLGIANVVGSQIAREADAVFYTRAGLEIGVAATKTFVCQVVAFYLLALKLAAARGSLPQERQRRLVAEVGALPQLIDEMMPGAREGAFEAASARADKDFFLYLGRHVGLPIALEGALKLKEISYIPTDAYAAGEMKHGPIALLSKQTPVICVATDSPVLEKIASNMAEVRARGASVLAITTAGSEEVHLHADASIEVPRTDWLLQPLLAVIPLQLLAYAIARHRGLNVDQPRNLAKTVTVE